MDEDGQPEPVGMNLRDAIRFTSLKRSTLYAIAKERAAVGDEIKVKVRNRTIWLPDKLR